MVNPFKMTGGLFLVLNPRLHWKGPVGRLDLVTIAGGLFPRAAEAETRVHLPSSKSKWSCPGSHPLGLAILSLFTCILTRFPEWKKTKKELQQAVETAQNKKICPWENVANRIILLYICHSRKTAKNGSLL